VIASSPCQRISLPTETRVEVVPPTAEQVKALAEAISPRYRAAVVTLAGSGLRIGELLGLRKGDVDFLRRSVRVERQRRQNGLWVRLRRLGVSASFHLDGSSPTSSRPTSPPIRAKSGSSPPPKASR